MGLLRAYAATRTINSGAFLFIYLFIQQSSHNSFLEIQMLIYMLPECLRTVKSNENESRVLRSPLAGVSEITRFYPFLR